MTNKGVLHNNIPCMTLPMWRKVSSQHLEGNLDGLLMRLIYLYEMQSAHRKSHLVTSALLLLYTRTNIASQVPVSSYTVFVSEGVPEGFINSD